MLDAKVAADFTHRGARPTTPPRNGWLRCSGHVLHTRARQVFRITPEGRRLLTGLRREVTELYEEIVRGREPDPAQRSSIGRFDADHTLCGDVH